MTYSGPELLGGMFYLPNQLTLLEQKHFVKFYLENKNSFIQPVFRSGSKIHLKMFCLGKHWNSLTNKYENSSNQIPNWMIEIINKYCKNLYPTQNLDFDICVINHYVGSDRLGLHRDSAESKETIASGHPVISFSIGASANFLFNEKYLQWNELKNAKQILLNSGDIITFGEKARLCYHGVNKLKISNKNPFSSFLNNGRLNFTFRKY